MADSNRSLTPEIAKQLKPRWSQTILNVGMAVMLITILGLAYTPSEMNNWPMLFTDSGNIIVIVISVSLIDILSSQLRRLLL